MAKRRVIVNADDFGQSAGVNRGILKAHDTGVVTSTSLMVRWPFAQEAAQAASSRLRLSVGLHVDLGEWTLQSGEWTPVYQVVLLDDAEAVSAEVHRQLDMFRSLMSREPTHLDSHQHVHRHEPVRSVLVALARDLSVPLRHFTPHVRYCGDFYGQDESGMAMPGVLCFEHLTKILSLLPPGITELACHPGFADDLKTLYCDERQQELLVLCDPRVSEAIDSLEIELSSFHNQGEQVGNDLSAEGKP